ncbi:hypothetical protein RhiirB3_528655 [Rhizophagus irregularis]|nr:hypothetical protein RhiirB3_528655 [Rhizophagus irregularis]
MANLQIPSHLILTQKQKEQLHSLPISEFTAYSTRNKWKIRCSIKTKGISILQCCFGNKDNNYMSIFGYLKHVEDCQRCLPHQPPPLYLNEMFLQQKNQRDLAWKFGHQKILHMDGTFVLDDQKRGIPIGYLLFSAAGEQENGYGFTPKVAITDCDHKERRALIEVWPNIHLILCLFNKRSTSIFKKSTDKLKNTIEPTTFFTQIIIDAVVFLKNKLNQETESKKISIIKDLAIGWCKYGRIVVVNLLQISLYQIPTTNNHLESFNSELKVHQLQKFQNNGHLLRFDFLSAILIKSITPNILLKRNLKIHSYHNSEIPSLSLSPQDSLHNPETTPTSHNEYEKTFHNPKTPQVPEKPSLSLYDQGNQSRDWNRKSNLFKIFLIDDQPDFESVSNFSKNNQHLAGMKNYFGVRLTYIREPVNSSLNHNVAFWKQEHITLATNLLANLNELELIAKSIKQLSVNVLDSIADILILSQF